MSSPIYEFRDMDPALHYAPRWARERTGRLPGRPVAPPGLRQVHRPEPDFSGDRAMIELQRRLALAPDAIPEPPLDDDNVRILQPIALRLSAVVAVAALIAWAVVVLPDVKSAGTITSSNRPTAELAASRADNVKLLEIHAAPVAVPVAIADVPVPPAAPPAATFTALPPAAPTPTVAPQPAASVAVVAPPPASPPNAVVPHFDSAQIGTMVARGQDYLLTGDLGSARLLLTRAAEAGSAEAALALGATFDPLVIARLGSIGAATDVVQARQWYQRAADLGSAAAMQQLAKLGQAQ